MGKEKIKIRYIIFVLITMGVIFFGKITRLDNLNAEKIAGIILVSPPYKKRITGQQKIEEFTILFNDRKKKPVFSITPPKWSGQSLPVDVCHELGNLFLEGLLVHIVRACIDM